MPRLPDVNALGQRPVPVSRQGVASADLTAVPDAVARVARIGLAAGKEYDDEQDRQTVFEARRKLDDWERTAIYDPQKGAAARRGKDAFGIEGQLSADFDKAAGEIGDSLLRTDKQRKAFAELATGRRSQILEWAARHTQKERESYDQGQFEADLKSFEDRATLYPDKAAGEIEMARLRIIGRLRALGRSEEEINDATKAQASKIHRGVIASMLDTNDGEGAAKYLAQNESGMTADDVLRAKKAMTEVVARAKAQSFGDDVFKRGLPLDQALKEAREKFSGKDEEAALHEVKTRFNELEVLKSRSDKETADKAWDIILNGGGRKNIPQSLWDKLDKSTTQRQILDYVEQKWRQARADADRDKSENWGTYMMLRDMANEDPAKFNDPQTLLKYEPFLSREQMNSLVNTRNLIGKDEVKARESLKAATQVETLVQAELKTAGIDTKAKEGSHQAKELAVFRGALYLSVDEAQRQKGAPLTDMEKRELGMRLLREGVEQGSGVLGMLQTKKRGYQIIAEGQSGKSYIVKPYGDIPADIRDELSMEFVGKPGVLVGRNGKPLLSDAQRAQVERAYTRGVEQGRFK